MDRKDHQCGSPLTRAVAAVALAVAGTILVANPAQAAPAFQLPFPCGQTWNGNQIASSAHVAWEIDFNRGSTATADLGDTVVVNLLWKGSTSQNCVTTLKMANVGTPTATSAFLEPQGSTRTTDSGSYSYYAGPVIRTAPSCVRWGGSTGGVGYTSGFEHCA